MRPFDLQMPVPFAYWTVCPKPSAKLAKIVAFNVAHCRGSRGCSPTRAAKIEGEGRQAIV